ncbi:hypothetical protein [Nocardioides sp. SYSU D00038]|uniref:hypothetical protein n=1 Tax=Nocardioides sp. SYSU D00038 TaxID=2812554 RepID=UPI0019685C2F|nr:hypothetical protein [Nocardioides sp. SYSU D00038]
MSWLGLVAGLLSATVFGLAAVAQAHAVRRFADRPDSLVGFVSLSVRDAWTMAVVAAYLLGFLLHAVAIWLLPLYLAQATVAMSLPVTAWAARRVDAALAARHWAAVGTVTLGLVLLSLGAGAPGEVVTTPLFTALLWAAVLGLLVAALLLHDSPGGLLGTLAGLGYAGSAIAVRGVETPVSAVVVLAALAVPSFSLVAFWVYSLGMRGGAVAAATAPMIVGQTFVPSVVGVALLGDGVRGGWWPVVVAGLLLSTAGAVALARQESEVALPG